MTMESSLTPEEQRFLLSEIIKTSAIDVTELGRFVRYHRVIPDWFRMQLPSGRNLNQCMHVAELHSLVNSALHQPAATAQSDPTLNGLANRQPQAIATAGSPSHQARPPPATSPSTSILPQLANRSDTGRILPHQAPKQAEKRKRGRPPRSGAKRDASTPLKTLAPWPVKAAPGSSVPRTILPAGNSTITSQTPLSPAIRYSPVPSEGRTSKKRRKASDAVAAVPPPSPNPVAIPGPSVNPAAADDNVQRASSNPRHSQPPNSDASS